MDKKLLFVASTRAHICHFHLPYLRQFKEDGWVVHGACGGDDGEIPCCDHVLHLPLRKRMFALGNFRHFGGNIDAGDRCHIPLQIVVKQHTGAAGHIQNIHIRSYLGIVQNLADDPVTLDHICIPKGGAAVEKFDNIFLLHSLPQCFSLAYHKF